MGSDRKRTWDPPESRPVTAADGRADERDVPVANGPAPSGVLN